MFIQSCCHESYKIIGKGEIGAYTDYYNPKNKTDTIKGEFYIIWQLEQKTSSLHNNFGLIQSTYATSCSETFENEVSESGFSISCNKDFKYNGILITAGTNFSDFEELKLHIEKKWGAVEIRFTNEFINLSEFEETDYTFKVNTKTNDNMNLENTLTVFMKIN